MSRFGRGLAVLYLCVFYVHSQTVCKVSDTDPCVCDFADGSGKIDLNKAGNSDGTARFTNIPDKSGLPETTYNYNPCHGFNTVTGESNLAGSATVSGNEVGLGTQDTAKFGKPDSGSTADFTISYTDNEISSSMMVAFVCSKSSDSVVNEPLQSENTILFTFTGKSACKGSGLGGISVGAVILIFLYRYKFKQANGSDVIPNKEFWTSLPGLMKDGASFLASKCGRSSAGDFESI